jgi:hypothetical protein
MTRLCWLVLILLFTGCAPLSIVDTAKGFWCIVTECDETDTTHDSDGTRK